MSLGENIFLLSIALICSPSSGFRAGFLSDIHLDPQTIRDGVNEAWRDVVISAGAENEMIEEVETADLENAADVMHKACRLVKKNPIILLVLSRCGCNPTLPFLSSALRLPIYEVPMYSREECPKSCKISAFVGNSKVGGVRQKINEGSITDTSSYSPRNDEALLGRYFACDSWKRMIIVYDDKKHLELVSDIINEVEDRMRKITLQKLPLSSVTHSLETESALTLTTELISVAMDDVWENTEMRQPNFPSKSRNIAFVLLGSENTVRKFVLELVPDLQYKFFLQYFIVDIGWTSDYFLQSLLFRDSVTVITQSEDRRLSPTPLDEDMMEDVVEKITSSLKIMSYAFLEAAKTSFDFTASDDVVTCSNVMTRFSEDRYWLANAVRSQIRNNTYHDSDRQSNTRMPVESLDQPHPYYIADMWGSVRNQSSDLKICDMADGQVQCISMMKHVTSQEDGKKCRSEDGQDKTESPTHVFVGTKAHEAEESFWFAEYSSKWENKTYKVATLEDEPFVFVRNDSDGHVTFSGFSIDLLHMLSEMFGFKYEVYEVKDRKYGAFKDGKWNGLVGDVVSKRADFAIAAMTITPQREKVVDFTKRYMDYAVGILMKKPKTVTNLFAFLNPFDNTVWYSIIAGLFLVSILLYVLNRVSPRRSPGPPFRETSLHGTFWFVYSSLVQQGTDMNLITLSSQIVTGVWWFFILIIISSYTANLAAHLTVTRMENHIASFRDLAKQTDLEYGTARDTSIYDFLRTKGTNSKDLSTIWASLWQVANGSNSVSDPKEGFQKVKQENYAFLWDVAVIEYLILTDGDCSYSTVPDSIYDKGYGIAVQQGHPIRDAMSLGILQLQDRGDINRLKERWWTSVGKCPSEHNGKRSHSSELTLENFAGVFCVLACGLVIASLVAVVELVQYMKHGKRPARNISKFKPKTIVTRRSSTVRRPTISRPQVSVEKCVGDDVHLVLKDMAMLKQFSTRLPPRQDSSATDTGTLLQRNGDDEAESIPLANNTGDYLHLPTVINATGTSSRWWNRKRKAQRDDSAKTDTTVVDFFQNPPET